jgi:putative transposase
VVVDTEGLPLAVQVQSAAVQDPIGAGPVLAEAKARAPDLQLVWGDGRYQGPLVAQAAHAVGLRVEVVSKPRRWVIERTFAWLGKYRRVAGRDYETNPRNSEAWIKICLSNVMLRRLAKRTISKPDD